MNDSVTVPVFVPHAGCPHQCSFCNQRAISGTQAPPGREEAVQVFEAARKSLGEKAHSAQLAFFGGSFTAIPAPYRRELLEAARPFLGEGGFSGIRISTRPDCIDGEILSELKAWGVTAIELGVQSMSDKVLAANGRGHTSKDVERAAWLILEAGFTLGLQMMTGLYLDDDGGAVETARRIAGLRPHMVRIYPALVLEETRLHQLYRSGAYKPQSLEGAVALGAKLLRFFSQEDIPVIRMGLHDEPGLKEQMVAGPYHPALRELCESRILLEDALTQLQEREVFGGGVVLYVHPRSVSRMVGQKRGNILALGAKGYLPKIRTDGSLGRLNVRVAVE